MKTWCSRTFLLLLLSSLSFLLYYIFFNGMNREHEYHPNHPRRNISILLWHWPFGRSYSLRGDKCMEMYNISHCLLTDDTSVFSTVDVVVFHHQELSHGLISLPLHLERPASQHWVWLSLEPPANNANLTLFNGLFNWTLSYRRDADISVPYGQTLQGGDVSYQGTSNRSCLVSWVVSNYKAHQTRVAIYNSLKLRIPIEVYGRWLKTPLSKEDLLPTVAKCFFYLAFENSEATDYITEKLWRNAYQAGSVPVVLGPSRATYEALAPPGSYIHVGDFNSTAALAAYLRYLAAHRQAYEEYMKWRHTHRIKTYTDWRERLCQICVAYPQLQTQKVYHDLEGWVNK